MILAKSVGWTEKLQFLV